MPDLESCLWSSSNLHTGLYSLAEASGMSPQHNAELSPFTENEHTLESWVDTAAGRLNVECQAVSENYPELEKMLSFAAPALLSLKLTEGRSFLLVVKSKRGKLQVLRQDLTTQSISMTDIVRLLVAETDASVGQQVNTICNSANLDGEARDKAERALTRAMLGHRPIFGCWLLRLPPTRPVSEQLRQRSVYSRFVGLGLVYLAQNLMMLGGWWLIGYAALSGSTERGWMLFWGLLLLSELPLRLWVAMGQGKLAIDLGLLIKKNLMWSALTAKSEEIRRDGAGKLLSRVLDAETIENASLQGGFLSLFALFEIVITGFVLALGACALEHVGLLILFSIAVTVMCWRQYRLRGKWTAARLNMTHRLIERVLGHRTRLAQLPASQWHDGEDSELSHYGTRSRAMDDSLTWIEAVVPRLWLLLGVALMAPAIVQGQAIAALAISIGGLLLGHRAFEKLVAGFDALISAHIAWRRLRPLLADEQEQQGFVPTELGDKGTTLLSLRNVAFAYPRGTRPAVTDLSLAIAQGDKILLQGDSGSGKSTLGKLLTGIYPPDEGLMLLRGHDYASLGGAAWRQRIACAPQFHENHILTETFAFNLLMGGHWPPTDEKWQEALDICEEIGLGPLLERMPGGMGQMVGETGWRLSHGECSRVYLARSLLQGADLVVLDESFAALDPVNMHKALDCVISRARSFVLIAHP